MLSRRRRLPQSPAVMVSAMRRRVLWSLGGLLLVLHAPLSQAGRVEVAWLHEVHDELAPSAAAVDGAGEIVVCGCQANAFYVTKFSAQGEQIWRQEFAADEGLACATAVASDAALNVYVIGTVVPGTLDEETEDMDIFVARLSPSGSLVWRHTLGTSYRDVSTSIRVVETASQIQPTVTSLIVGGYSGGSLVQGKASPSNCQGGLPEGADLGACDAGFVAKLTAEAGSVEWIKAVASVDAGETRVFDLAVDELSTNPVLVVVGETHGDLRHQSSTRSTVRHAGDVFVRRLDLVTGEMQWTTQLGSAASAELCQIPASSSSASSYTRVYPRGRCGIALHPTTQELSIAATTYGLVSTFPSQKQQYPTMVCSSPVCMQLFVARLKSDSGSVQWVRQLIHAASTSAEAAVALSSGDLAVLGTASAGFFRTAESMEQLLVLRIALDGVAQWTTELGLNGEDHATAIVATDSELFVLSHGSADKSRRGQLSTQSNIRRVRASDGLAVPVCVDVVEFDKSQSINITRGPASGNTSNALQVQLPVRRDPARLCAGSAASIDYLSSFTAPTGSFSSGRVHFASGQTTASMVVVVPPGTSPSATLHVSLQSVVRDMQVNASRAQWSVSMEEEEVAVSQGVAAADGHLWRQLTWLTLVGAAVVTVLMVVVGRLGWVGACGSWRKAKIFQYRTLRMRQPSASTSAKTRSSSLATPVKSKAPKPLRLPASDASEAQQQDEDETDELRAHLEEIQQLNQALGGLLHQHASDSTATTSPRSSMARLPTIPDEAGSPRSKIKKAGWRRSVRNMAAPSRLGSKAR